MDHSPKRSVLDVLMYLIEYCDDEELEIGDSRGQLEADLCSAGFASQDVGKAFDWLESLAIAGSGADALLPKASRAMRVFSAQEETKLSLESRGFLIGLEQAQLISRECLESVLDRVVALDTDEIDLEELKWVVLMVLFNRPGHEQLSLSVEHLFRAGSAADLH